MALVSSVDYVNKRIYLSAETTNTSIDTLQIYREVRAMRRINENHQKFKPMIVAGGSIPKITGISFTPAYVQLLYGCRVVPYDSNHTLKLVRDTFTDDGNTGRDIFDRTSITSSVNIDVDVLEIEIRNSSGGLTSQQEAILIAISKDTALIPVLL